MPAARIASPAARSFASSATTAALSASRPFAWNACAYGPVWSSQTRAPIAAAASICPGSASMNTLVTMPASASRFTTSASALRPARHVEAALGRDLLPALGHEHRHLGTEPARDVDHRGRGRHLEVELDVRELAQAPHVLVLDVAAVLAQVHRDAVRAAQVRLDRRPHRVRLVGAPRLADRRDVVDVDAQLDHSVFSSSRAIRSRTTLRLMIVRASRWWSMISRIRRFASAAVAASS